MKKPFLILATATFTLAAATSVFAITPQPQTPQAEARNKPKPAPKPHHPLPKHSDQCEGAWEKMENKSKEVGEDIADFFEGLGQGARDIAHERPELQAIPHLVVLSKGKQVQIVYCKSAFAHIFRNRDHDGKAGARQCSEPLHKGSFNIKELQACTARHSSDLGLAADALQRQLATVERRNEHYGYNYEAKYGSRSEYRNLFATCAKEIAVSHRGHKPKGPIVAKKPAAPAKPMKPKTTVEVIDAQPIDELNAAIPAAPAVEPAPVVAAPAVPAAPAVEPAPAAAPPTAPVPVTDDVNVGVDG